MPPACVRVDDNNRVLGPCTREDVLAGAPHRVVWGMLYHPVAQRWALQWRRPDKGVCPLQWDMSCAGHVDWVNGAAESYQAAYARELGEELGLTTVFWPDQASLLVGWRALSRSLNPILTLDLGASAEYVNCLIQGGETRLMREHAGHYLTLYAGPLTLQPDAEPLAMAWMSTAEAHQIILDAGLAAPGLAIMLERCDELLASLPGATRGSLWL